MPFIKGCSMMAPRAVKKVFRRQILIPFSLAIVILSGIFLLFFLRNDPATLSLLQEGNRLVAAGDFEEARRVLDAGMQKKILKSSVKEILRLHALLSKQDDNWQDLLRASTKATEMYRNEKTFWAYRIVAESRTGLHEAAVQHAELYLTKEEYAGLWLEAHLSAEIDVPLSDIPENYKELFELTQSRNSDAYMRIARHYKNDELALQGILLAAENIGTREAYGLLDQNLVDRYPDVTAYLAYDQEEYLKALTALKKTAYPRSTDKLILLSDIYMALGYTSSALEVYQRIKMLETRLYPEILHNLSRLEDDLNESLRLLDEGCRTFPENRFLSLSRITLMLDLHEEKALSLLEEHLQKHPTDGYAKILWETYRGHGKIVDVYTARLWLQEHDNHRIGEQTASYTLGFLAATGRTDEMGQFLHHQEAAYGKTSWYLFYQGLYHAVQGNYPEAVDLLTQSWELEERPETLYNMAVIRRARKDYPSAGNLLTRALIQAHQRYTLTEKPMAMLEQQLAEVFYVQGYRSEALYFARRALVHDPGNLQARQLEKTIMKEGKE